MQDINSQKIHIESLFDFPIWDSAAILTIHPLAPLSLVGDIPGSYYRTLNEPTQIMIFGMLENMLGWHFSSEIRKEIIKEQQRIWKKRFKGSETLNYHNSEVKYTPLLQNHLKIEFPALLKPQVERYEDYWTQHLKGSDMRHLNGSRNYDWTIESKIRKLGNEQKILDSFFKENKEFFPKYYSSPKKREFIAVKGSYGYKIHTNSELLDRIIKASEDVDSPTYLGTNEGWVHVNIKKL